MCQQGIPFGPDASQACDLYTKAADQGHVGAIFNLACLYRDGQCDVEQDLVRAKELFEAAAAKGHAAALCGLAGLHDAEGDHIGSFKLYKRAATSGYSTALHNVACALRSGEGVERNMEMVSEGTMVRCSSISDCACWQSQPATLTPTPSLPPFTTGPQVFRGSCGPGARQGAI